MVESEGLTDFFDEKMEHKKQQHGFLKRFILIYKKSGQEIDLATFYKSPKVLQDIIATVFSALVFFLMIFWLLSAEYCFEIDQSMDYSSKRNEPLPSIVWYTTNVWWIRLNKRITCANGSRTFECEVFKRQTAPENPDAYLFYAPDVDHFPLPRKPDITWGLFHDESPANRLMFVYEETLNLFNFSSTFSRFSDMPMPLMKSKGLEALTNLQNFVNTSDKNLALSEIAPVLYIQSDCNTLIQRDAYVKKLMEFIPVDSYGACLRNKDMPLNEIYKNSEGRSVTYILYLYGNEMLSFISRYKFIITIENAVCNDYISEKLWRALEVGTVPIYYGSPLIRDWLPNNKSAILLEDFPTPELLSQHLHYLLQNDTAYEEYLEHKIFRRISNQNFLNDLKARPYQIDVAGTAMNFECLICERLYDNDDSVHIVTKKHYNCPEKPVTALKQSINTNNIWMEMFNYAKTKVDSLIKEVTSENMRRRISNTSWWISQEQEKMALHIND